MIRRSSIFAFLVMALVCSLCAGLARGQASGTIEGVVKDPSGGVVPNAIVEISYSVSGYDRQVATASDGTFRFTNVPFNTYHMVVTANGFASYTEDVDVRTTVPVSAPVNLKVSAENTTVNVEANGGDLVENEPVAHTDIDRGLFNKLPLESQSSSLSSLITLASPGVVADSNGLFHGLGDHAENSFMVDDQPITDQVSKVFSNQVPVDSIQSLEVIEGAPPAEYGGKTSVVAKVTTRSGLATSPAVGSVYTSYGSFGTASGGFDVAYGNQKWGNFVAANGLRTGRFLDPPEHTVLHDKGNEENFFDRLDYQFRPTDTVHLNLNFTRSWFQTPNTWDQQLQECNFLSAMCSGASGTYASGSFVLNPITGAPVGPTDQRSQIRTFNVAPTWTRLVSSDSVLTAGLWVRHDQYNYYPSPDPFSDLGPLQDETVSQLRFLTNAGAKLGWSYVHGIHNLDIGATYEHTFLSEHDTFGIVNPGLLAGCTTAACTTLQPYDLTAGGTLFHYFGHTDVKETAFYVQDNIKKGPWAFNLGLRGDIYYGLQASSGQAEPRLGLAYNLKKTNSVFRISYARTLESPFNENLIISGTGCLNPVVSAILVVAQGFPCGTFTPTGQAAAPRPLTPGFRNEFHAGLEQAFGKHFVLSGEYIWKYTHNGYDFNVFGTSPITLPIIWHNSKIPGFAVRGSMPDFHGVSAFIVLSHVSARFFPPTVSGIAPPQPPGVFRIDHDEIFGETTHLQYQPWKRGPWLGFNWRYDSGLVSGFVPCEAQTATCSFSTSSNDVSGGLGLANGIPAGSIALVNNLNGLPLTADQEFQSGITCNGVAATPTTPIGTLVPGASVNGLPFPVYACQGSQLKSNLVKIPGPNTENDDHKPQRIQPRHLFDLAVGHDNLFHGDKYRWSLQFTVINLGNSYSLYNFLSTFSGTHYVTPRTETVQLGFHF